MPAIDHRSLPFAQLVPDADDASLDIQGRELAKDQPVEVACSNGTTHQVGYVDITKEPGSWDVVVEYYNQDGGVLDYLAKQRTRRVPLAALDGRTIRAMQEGRVNDFMGTVLCSPPWGPTPT